MKKNYYLVLFLGVLIFSGIMAFANLKAALGFLMGGMIEIGFIRILMGKPI